MKKTKKLTIQDYPHIYDRQAELLKQVNLESEKMYSRETPPLPKFQEIKVEPLTALFNVKNYMKELIKQLRLALMILPMKIVLFLCPKDCINTLKWIRDMPLED